MNALPIWDAEQRLEAAPVLGTTTSNPETAASDPETAVSNPGATAAALPGGHRGAALVEAVTALEPGTSLAEAVERLLEAIDNADAEAGYARVDTTDTVLQQRIARLVSGAGLPSRGPGTQARDILSILRGYRPA